MKLLLFDIDGTLISTGGAGVRALDRAFQQVLQLDNAMNGIRCHGKTDPAIVREVFAARGIEGQSVDTIRRILDAYVHFLEEEVRLTGTYVVLPGIIRFLQEFGGHPTLACGLATGNVERGARIKLERGGLNRHFAFGGFGGDGESRADLVRHAAERGARQCGRSIAPEDVFVIGDTPRDIEAGRAGGFRTVAVATSSYPAAELSAAGADLVMADFERDLDPFLRMTGLA